MIHVYSLADHQLTIGIPERVAREANLRDENGNYLQFYQIGGPGENGEGSFVGEIGVERNVELWTTEGDNTGSWVHNKNLNRTGRIRITIKQISDQVIDLIHLCQIYESISDNQAGLTLTINTNASDETMPIATGNDCYIVKMPDIPFGNEAANLEWIFTCGQVIYN